MLLLELYRFLPLLLFLESDLDLLRALSGDLDLLFESLDLDLRRRSCTETVLSGLRLLTSCLLLPCSTFLRLSFESSGDLCLLSLSLFPVKSRSLSLCLGGEESSDTSPSEEELLSYLLLFSPSSLLLSLSLSCLLSTALSLLRLLSRFLWGDLSPPVDSFLSLLDRQSGLSCLDLLSSSGLSGLSSLLL